MEETISEELPSNPYITQAEKISALKSEVAKKICADRVVGSLAVAIKELVENSIDAGATRVMVRIKNNGLDSVEVADNGKGVKESDFEALTRSYHTSKLSEFDDLESIGTFGFRGEALSSLCRLCGGLEVTTRHASASCAARLSYDAAGNIVSNTPCAGEVGTRVTLKQLFSPLPVRRKVFMDKCQYEFNKSLQMLHAYCIIAEGVRIQVSHQRAEGKECTMLVNSPGLSLRDNLACVAGHRALQDLLTIQAEGSGFVLRGLISSCAHGSGRRTTDKQFFYVNGRPCDLPKANRLLNQLYRQYNRHQAPLAVLDVITRGAAASADVNLAPDKRSVALKGEPAMLDLLKSTLLELFETIPCTLPVNNQPLLSFSGSVLQPKSSSVARPATSPAASSLSKFAFNKLRSPQSEQSSPVPLNNPSTHKSNASPKKLDSVSKENTGEGESLEVSPESPVCAPRAGLAKFLLKRAPRLQEGASQLDNIAGDKNDTRTNPKAPPELGSDSTVTQDDVTVVMAVADSSFEEQTSNLLVTKSPQPTAQSSANLPPSRLGAAVSSPPCMGLQQFRCQTRLLGSGATLKRPAPNLGNHGKCMRLDSFVIRNTKSHEEVLTETHSQEPEPTETAASDSINSAQSGSQPEKNNSINQEVTETIDIETGVQTFTRPEVCVSMDLTQIITGMRRARLETSAAEQADMADSRFQVPIEEAVGRAAEQELQREISKDMFLLMRIIGQFNRAFVLASLGRDVFIVDQHAADEKFNFERLSKTAPRNCQRLVIPQPLNLNPIQESVFIDQQHVFKESGFEFMIGSNSGASHVSLTAVPTLLHLTLGQEDIQEMLHQLQESPLERPQAGRVRAALASKACRQSIMVGRALQSKDMRKLLDNLSTLDQPWNCPHGRPTMRHLVNIEVAKQSRQHL